MLNSIKISLVIILFIFSSAFVISRDSIYVFQNAIELTNVLEPQPGEELIYEVSYGFIPIGTIKMQVLNPIEKENSKFYTVKCFIDSYNLPFVNVHYVMYSELDDEMWSRFFSGWNTSDKKNIWFLEYDFLYNKNKIKVEHGSAKTKKIHLSMNDTISTKYQDGLSLFYYARKNLYLNESQRLPTYMNEKKLNTSISFTTKNEEVKIDAVPYTISTRYFNGNIEYRGVYGLTGNYEGWFSNDRSAVPIRAKMKVLIGSVNIELIKWKRNNWSPPKS